MQKYTAAGVNNTIAVKLRHPCKVLCKISKIFWQRKTYCSL